MKKTEYLKLNLPEDSDVADINVLNENTTKLDSKIKSQDSLLKNHGDTIVEINNTIAEGDLDGLGESVDQIKNDILKINQEIKKIDNNKVSKEQMETEHKKLLEELESSIITQILLFS